jgi:hypothetical protein
VSRVDAAIVFGTGLVEAVAAFGVFMIGAYQLGASISRSRRAAKNIAEGKDKTALEEIAESAKEANDKTDLILTVLEGRKPTLLEPHPPPGLVAVVVDHGQKLDKLLPNGGNTDNPGDLILKLAQNAGVTEDDK